MRRVLCFAVLSGTMMLASTQTGFTSNLFDGTYVGARTVTHAGAPFCNDGPNSRTLRVVDDHFPQVWGTVKMSVGVGADGAFAQVTNNGIGRGSSTVSVAGSIKATKMEFDLTTANCEIHYSLQKS